MGAVNGIDPPGDVQNRIINERFSSQTTVSAQDQQLPAPGPQFISLFPHGKLKTPVEHVDLLQPDNFFPALEQIDDVGVAITAGDVLDELLSAQLGIDGVGGLRGFGAEISPALVAL